MVSGLVSASTMSLVVYGFPNPVTPPVPWDRLNAPRRSSGLVARQPVICSFINSRPVRLSPPLAALSQVRAFSPHFVVQIFEISMAGLSAPPVFTRAFFVTGYCGVIPPYLPGDPCLIPIFIVNPPRQSVTSQVLPLHAILIYGSHLLLK